MSIGHAIVRYMSRNNLISKKRKMVEHGNNQDFSADNNE